MWLETEVKTQEGRTEWQKRWVVKSQKKKPWYSLSTPQTTTIWSLDCKEFILSFFFNLSYCYFEFSVNMQSQQMFFSPTKYKSLSGKADGEISTFYTNARVFLNDALNALRSWRWLSFFLVVSSSILLSLGDSVQTCVTDTNGCVSHAGLHLLGLYCFTGGWRIARGSNESLAAPQLGSGMVMVPFLTPHTVLEESFGLAQKDH